MSPAGEILLNSIFLTLLPVIYIDEKVTCTQYKYKNLHIWQPPGIARKQYISQEAEENQEKNV